MNLEIICFKENTCTALVGCLWNIMFVYFLYDGCCIFDMDIYFRLKGL